MWEYIRTRSIVWTFLVLFTCSKVMTQDESVSRPPLVLQTIIPQSASFNVIPLCLETFDDITLSVNHFLTVDTVYFERPVGPVAPEVNRAFQCNWTGIFRNPSPDHLIEVTIDYLDGLDQGINFITLGDGDDFSDKSSIVFRRTGHHEARGYQFSLKKVYLRNAFWVKFETATEDLKITLGINLVRNAFCDEIYFQCDDGSCIHASGKLNGYPDCPDGSDESPSLGFRDCAYNFTYTGNQTDDRCTPWEDGPYSDRGLIGKLCRSLPDYFIQWPGCWSESTQEWIRCQIPVCNIRSGCYNGSGEDYRDIGHHTDNGYVCIDWSDVPPVVFDVQIYSNADLSNNYCRNPTGSGKPWCFYQDENNNMQRGFCQIDICLSQDLGKFHRLPKVTFDINSFEHSDLQNLYLGRFTEEDCASSCLFDMGFTCRSFIYRYEGTEDFSSLSCMWSSVSPTSVEGDLLEFHKEIDVFIRTETECDSFRVDHLPEYCPLPLGLKEDFYDQGRDRRRQPGIQDRAISASSYSDESFHPRFVRYDSSSCWKNSSDDSEPWIQVDFEDLHIITGIVLQACEETGWVEEFTIQSKRAVNAYITHRDRTTGRRVFSGNVNPHCARVVAFDPWIYAESIRVIPVSWNTEVGLRFELLGCQEDCDYALGLTDLRIFDAAITASSLLDDLHPPRSARIQPLGLQFESRLGWSPDLEADGGVPSWIQVNFPNIQVMKAVITQGCKESNSYLETFTFDYTVAADADDDDDIQPYTRPGSDEYLIFNANTDSETLVRNDLPFQVHAQFVRVNAISWGGSGPPCMKFEIIGCAYEICGQSLGIGKGTLGETISTSSIGACTPETYKLHGNSTFAFSNAFSTTERIIEGTLEITLPEEYSITGIVTQGALLHSNSEYFTWATKYRLLYSRGAGDGNDFRDRPYVSISGAQKEFDANYDSITPIFNELDRPIAATSLKLIIYNHEVVSLNYPCIRFDLIGCKVSERGFPCGSSAQELGGYCMGSVEGGNADACVNIFHSSSHEAILSQPNTLADVISNFLQLLLPGYTHYLIGLIHAPSRPFISSLAPFVWLDGTPLLDISEFDPDIDYQNSTEQLCVTIDLTDQLSWKALPCDSAAIVPASLCQFDIDECLQDTYVCSHGCINYPGGYQCSCPEGMYLEPGPGQESCRSICEVLGLSLSPSLPDSCIEFHSGSDFETANGDCRLTGKRLMTANELLSVTSEWIGVFPLSSIWVSPTDRLDTDCYVAELGVILGEVQVLNTPCRSNVTFICVQDDLPPTFELFTSYNTTNYTVSDNSLYIIWTGLAPWFGTLTSANLDIRVEAHLILRVYFVYSNLRRQPFPGSGCLDRLVLWENLPDGRRRRQGEYCSELSDFNLESTTNHITLSLMVDDFVPNMPNYITLQLLYESRDCSIQECNIYCASADQNYTAPQGQLQTFNFPEILPPYYSCSWTIWLEPGSFVRLQFLEVNIACSERHLVNIFSRLKPGKNRLDMKNPAMLCEQTEAITISERNLLVITYDTGLTQRSGGFQAVYETSDIPGCRLDPKEDIEGCSETRCEFPRAYIASPNFPSPYVPPFICHWVITTEPGTFISLRFLEFDIPDDVSCMREYVSVEDSEQVKRFCNANTTNQPIPDYHSSRNEVQIRFSSVGRFLALYEQMYFTSSTPLVLASDNDYHCPDGWYLYNKRCFSIENSNIEIRWTEAVSLCSRKNNRTQAVSIRNVGEANFIHDLILNKVSKSLIFYIGLFKSDGRFRWTDDSPLSYTDWYQREYNYDEIQPDGGQIEACSAIYLRNFDRSDNWFDVPCAARSTNYYICAQPAIADSPPDRMKRITFHTEDCRGGYFRISQKCLRLISTNNSSRNSDSGDLCPGDSSAVPKQFVLSNLIRIQFHLNYIWSIPDGEIEIQTMKPNNFELLCFKKGPVRQFELKTGNCNASQTFGLCSLATTDIVQVCADNQFQCDTGECINTVFVCDFTSDCSDGSDEASCVQGDSLGLEGTCGPSQFKCRDNVCIQTSFLCDFKSDCPDGSDEDSCAYPDCLEDEFLCDNKQCIPLSGYCNLIEDCVDGSDEVFCVTAEGNFQCYSSVWLPGIAYCDGHRDCVGQGYEDEPRDCDYFGSGFSCNSTNDVTCKSGTCTRKRNLCLLEENEYGFMNGCRDLTHLQACERFECTGLTYKCPDSYCIPQHYRCNNVPDCPGKEDELNCKNYICEGAYRCRDSPSCLAQQFVCDGIKQCPNGDDELFCEIDCPDNCTCSGLTYFCLNVIWSAEHVAGIPRNVKQLSLTNLQLSGRSKRQAIDGAVTILDATFLNIDEFSLLYSLDLSSNGITHLGNGTFTSSLNLQILNLSFNAITDLNSMTFLGLENLKELDLQGNPLTDITGSPFQNLGILTFLSIQSSEVIVSSSSFVTGLDSIEIFRSERFYYCCLLEGSTTLQECLPQPDEFSSCTDLIRSTLQRIVIWLMALSSLSGNIIVILLRLFKRKKPATRRGNTAQPLFIMNLAIADLLMGCYLLMIAIADISYRGRYGLFSDIWQNSFFCRLAGFLSTISSVTSVIFLTVISIDRYQSVLYPLSPRRLRAKSATVVCISVWSVMVFVSALPAVIFAGDYYGRSSVCIALPITADRPSGWLYSFLLYIVFNLLLFLIMLVCYIGIFIIAKRSSKFSTSLSKSELQLKEEQLQIAVKVFMLVGSDFLCWMPIIIMGFLALTPAAVSGDVYAWTAIFILPINSAVNPHLYTFIIEKSQRKETKAVTSRDTDNTGLVTPDSSPAIQRLRIPKTGTGGLEQDESVVMKLVLSSMRSNRVLAPSSKERYQKHQLSTLKSSPNFRLTNEEKEDIIADVGKALKHLHAVGVTHGNVNEEYVIVDELHHGNKRAYLLMFSSPKEKSDLKQEENSADHNELELLEVKLSKTKDGFAEDLKQLEMFSLRLQAED